MLGTLKKTLQLREWFFSGEDTNRSNSYTIQQLHAGDKITFGQMEQEELSHTTCIAGRPTLYHFNQVQFHSYPLFDQSYSLLCQMIIASREGESSYLALSRRIPESRKIELWTEEDYKRVCKAEYPQHLYVREHTAQMEDWLYLHYQCKIRSIKGTSIAPDSDVKAFSYTLYVSQEEYKALEIERYPSGESDVYATVFRPLSDIVKVEHNSPAKAIMEEKLKAGEIAAATAAAREKLQHIYPSAMPVAEPVTPPENEPQQAETIAVPDEKPQPKKNKIKNPVVEAVNKDSARIFELPVMAMQTAPGQMALATRTTQITPDFPRKNSNDTSVRCNLRMASKLIDEAMRNDMRVTDVMRKALGLGITEEDYVAFDLHLTERDYKILADRFELDIRNRDKIHELILEELRHFTGEPVE